MSSTKIVLTIGGSDSGGAAGVQADLKAWSVMGAYGMSTITAVTAQNSVEVAGVEWMSADFVRQQINTVLSDYGLNAVKTGLLGRADIVETIAEQLRRQMPLVVDPVLVNQFGRPMFDDDLLSAYFEHLFPLASILTPNVEEAALLADIPVEDLSDAREAAEILHDRVGVAILITGMTVGEEKVNLFYDGGFRYYPMVTIDTKNVHGSGDVLSAAIALRLAQGDHLTVAVEYATTFTHERILAAKELKIGEGHGPLALFC